MNASGFADNRLDIIASQPFRQPVEGRTKYRINHTMKMIMMFYAWMPVIFRSYPVELYHKNLVAIDRLGAHRNSCPGFDRAGGSPFPITGRNGKVLIYPKLSQNTPFRFGIFDHLGAGYGKSG
jgi:hypothetical protein